MSSDAIQDSCIFQNTIPVYPVLEMLCVVSPCFMLGPVPGSALGHASPDPVVGGCRAGFLQQRGHTGTQAGMEWDGSDLPMTMWQVLLFGYQALPPQPQHNPLPSSLPPFRQEKPICSLVASAPQPAGSKAARVALRRGLEPALPDTLVCCIFTVSCYIPYEC